MVAIRHRVRDSGRLLPNRLEYIDSWVEPNFARGFQPMRCEDLRLFQKWALRLAWAWRNV